MVAWLQFLREEILMAELIMLNLTALRSAKCDGVGASIES